MRGRATTALVPDNTGTFYFEISRVGMQGIEPCLTAPKAVVLPVYDIPSWRSARTEASLKYLIFGLESMRRMDVREALVVQWIEQDSSKVLM